MTILKKLLPLEKFSSSLYSNKSLSYVKFHTNTVKNDKKKPESAKNLCRPVIVKEKRPCDVDKNVKDIPGGASCDERNPKMKDSVTVAVVGGGSSAAYALLFLKQNPSIKEIHVIDMDNSLIASVCDLTQIDTFSIVKHYRKQSIVEGLRTVDIVALLDETNFTMGDKEPFAQFKSSCNYVKNVSECITSACPKALVAVFAHPVTATLPLVSEIFKVTGIWNPNRIIGSAALESMRISALTGALLDLNPSFVTIPIAGGVDSATVVPLLSRTRPFNTFTMNDQCMILDEFRNAEKCLHESEIKGPNLSSGLAVAKFISILINGMKGQNNSVASAYVRSDIFPSCKYMTSELKFGPDGVQNNFGLPKINAKEINLIEQAAVIINKVTDAVTDIVRCGKCP